MDVLVMAALGALVGAGLLAVGFTLSGVRLFRGFGSGAERVLALSERFALWLVGAFVLAVTVWGLTSWPVAGLWVFVAVLSLPLMGEVLLGALGLLGVLIKAALAGGLLYLGWRWLGRREASEPAAYRC